MRWRSASQFIFDRVKHPAHNRFASMSFGQETSIVTTR
jgi:hypothetical protein